MFFFEKTKKDRAKVKEQTRDMVGGFAVLYQKVLKGGALSLGEKEFELLAFIFYCTLTKTGYNIRKSVFHIQ